MASSMNGTIHDKYELMLHCLGQGEFSQVRLALSKEERRRVAVKVMANGTVIASRIRTEIMILRRLDRLKHPNIVRMLDTFEDEDETFIVFEFLSGGSLLGLLESQGRLSEPSSRLLIRQISSALKALHEMGIVHRDVKPENILFDDEGTAKLVDFGFAKAYDTSDSSLQSTAGAADRRFASSPCGTPGFVAPEVLQRSGYSCAVDMWSLGVLTFMAIYGQAPFSDSPR